MKREEVEQVKGIARAVALEEIEKLKADLRGMIERYAKVAAKKESGDTAPEKAQVKTKRGDLEG